MEYAPLCAQLRALTDGVPNRVTNLANAAALLYHALPNINWAGFYLVENGVLWLGPFQGKPACTRIEKGRGVCGTAYEKAAAQVVADVHAFPGHIACDAESRAEIVVPLFKNGAVFGVLDIDSPEKDRFDENDRQGLEEFARVLEARLP